VSSKIGVSSTEGRGGGGAEGNGFKGGKDFRGAAFAGSEGLEPSMTAGSF